MINPPRWLRRWMHIPSTYELPTTPQAPKSKLEKRLERISAPEAAMMYRWDRFMDGAPFLAWLVIVAILAAIGVVLTLVLTFAGFWAFAVVGVAASIAIMARM